MKNITIFTILGTIIFSCSNVQCESCSKDVINSLELIGEGDNKVYQKFMDKYKDPNFCCCEEHSGLIIDRSELCLENFVLSSNSIEITKDYFKFNLSQVVKNKFLNGYVNSDSDEIIKFLIGEDAKLETVYFTFHLSSVESLKKLHKYGYDFNYIDPNSGNNFFLDYSMCAPKNSQDHENVIECLKYLNSIGVDIKSKNLEGKTAIDLAPDSLVREYLKTL